MAKIVKVLVNLGIYILLPFAIIVVSWEFAKTWVEELCK